MQFDFGYYYSFVIALFNLIGLCVCCIYALEPINTWLRLYQMRQDEIRRVIEFRAQLIRDAKERKETRRQKKLARFENFKIDLDNNG